MPVLCNVFRRQAKSDRRRSAICFKPGSQGFITDAGRFLYYDSLRSLKERLWHFDGNHFRLFAQTV